MKISRNSRNWIISVIVITIVTIPWIFEAIGSKEEEGLGRGPDLIMIGGPITSIPEEYNEHPLKLLEDYQKREISLHQVVQILILYQDRGEFKGLYETDTELDKYWIDKQEHQKIDEWKKEIYQQRSKK